MKYNAYVISDAEKDLLEIYDYIKKSRYPQKRRKNFFRN